MTWIKYVCLQKLKFNVMKKLLLFVVTFLALSCSDDDSVIVNDDLNNEIVDDIDDVDDDEIDEDAALVSYIIGSWVNKGSGTVEPDEFILKDCESESVNELVFSEDEIFHFGMHCEEDSEFFLGSYSINDGVLTTTNYGIEHTHNFKYVYDMEIVNENRMKLYFTEFNENPMDGNWYEIYERIQ